MEMLTKGAEADLYLDNGKLVKERIKKEYRIPYLDERLRKLRTRRESKLLENAKRAGVSVPRIYKTDINERKLMMEFIPGRILKDVIDSSDEKTVRKFADKIGRMIAKLHDSDIIHNDLTTSNMILNDGRIYLIDFGLGMTSTKVEDKAMDLVVLKKAMHVSHTERFEVLWDSVINSYRENSCNGEITARIKAIEKRGRYV